MMRKNAKRKNPAELKFNKRLKPLTLDLPVPHHIELTDDKQVVYHFPNEEQANSFLQKLQNQSALQEEGIQSVKVNAGDCQHNPQHIHCARVSLIPDQFNAWLGRESFYKLSILNHYFQHNEFRRLAIELTDIDPILANQAALLVDQGWNFLISISNDEDFPFWKFMPFLQVLGTKTIQQAAQHMNRDKNNGFRILMENLNPESALFILNHLSIEDCNRLVLQQDNDGNTALMYTAVHQPPEVFTVLLSKLSADTLNTAALQQSNAHENFLSLAARHQPPKVLAGLINSLSVDTCNKISSWKDDDNFSVLQYIAAWQPVEVYKLFEEKLTFESRMQNVFPSYINQPNDEGEFPRFGFASCGADKPAVKLVSSALQHPQELKKYAAKNSQLHMIEFFDSGSSHDVWSDFADSMVWRAPAVKKRSAELDLSSKLLRTTVKREIREIDYLSETTKQGWKFLRTQGRTVLLEDKKGNLRAVKIQKKQESEDALLKEYDTTNYLNRNAQKLGLKSQFPKPVLISKTPGVFKWLKKQLPAQEYALFIKRMSSERKKTVYIYDVDPKKCDYFTYLHDAKLSDQTFNKANRDAVHDLFTLLKQGVVFPQLGDIFHNLEQVDEREDRGRYMVLVNILRDFDFRGSGRLTGWKEAVSYPNVRASGIADLGDRVSINDYIGDGDKVEKFYKETKELYGEKAGNYLLANVMAEYQYILFLIAGRRGGELTDAAKKANKSPEEINLIWLNLAKQIMDNCIQATALLTNKKESEIAKILNAVVDVNRLGRQMQYWMTTDYIEDLMNNRIKEGIYEPGTQITVDMSRFRENTFNPRLGCSIDGVHQDLGPVNGQEPIKEANKLFYWMVTKVFETFNLLHMTVKDLKKITDEKDITKSENLRAQLFTHLPNKQYHKLQQALCEERLKQKKLPKKLKEKLKTESHEHKTEYAALTIQNFWRNYRKPVQDLKDEKVDESLSLAPMDFSH